MRIYRHFPTSGLAPTAVAIGNFDGMHIGHQSLLKHLTGLARVQGLASSVMTFEPHPREFFTPQQAPARLTSLREKLEHLADVGVDQVFVCHFNQRFAQVSAENFMQDILRNRLQARTILVGDDFRFGAGRKGSVTDFQTAGFDLISFPQVQLGGERVSSTRVRKALAEGDLKQATLLLGRLYSISGKVVHGAKRGRQLGFPTANIHMRHERPALTGVYAVKLNGLNGVANLGVRPTLAGVPKLALEVHLLDFAGDLYGQHVHVQFVHKIRDEMRFATLDALQAQIAQDVIVARNYFKNAK